MLRITGAHSRPVNQIGDGVWDQSLVYLFAALMSTGGAQRGNVAFSNFKEPYTERFIRTTLADVQASIIPFRKRLDIVRPKGILDLAGPSAPMDCRGETQRQIKAAAEAFGCFYVPGPHPNRLGPFPPESPKDGGPTSALDYYDQMKRLQISGFKKLVAACALAFKELRK
jgi:hypothetical protein